MRNKTVLAGAVLLVVLITALWIINKDERENNPEKIEKKRHEPPFKKEGVLYIEENSEMDTLAIIEIEIADTPEDIRQGMMYRTRLEANHGMFFLFDGERERSFWMKNTILSLDILFINASGRIVHIAEHTIPYSKDPIPSIYPAQFVLEVNAGFCREHGITAGHIVHFTYNNV